MKRKLLCAFALCFLSVSALADAPDETERLVVYTSHKEEVYQPIVEEFERRTGVWVQVVSGGTTELLERIAAEAETPVADVMFGGGVESLLAYEDYFCRVTRRGRRCWRAAGLKPIALWRFRACRW
ncbi:MAG: hypothetical protein ACLUI3_14885 [Christensenellales bacterium]